MTPRIRLLILATVLFCLILIGRQVRRREIRARYLVLWVSLCFVVLPLVAIPGAVDWISGVFGIYYPPATFLLAAIVILFLVTIDFSHEISKLDERTRILAEELALSRVVSASPAQTRAPTSEQTEATSSAAALTADTRPGAAAVRITDES